jgi:hypothetical protein
MAQPKAKYAAPTITVMNEEEVLKAFQLTSAMAGWWVPGFVAST